MEEIKVGVDEKKKTQGMRRDSEHFCGVLFLFFGWCAFLGGQILDEKENFEVRDIPKARILGWKQSI